MWASGLASFPDARMRLLRDEGTTGGCTHLPEGFHPSDSLPRFAAGRAKAEAILAVCAHHPHKLLVVDEGAALRMLELLRP